MILQANRLQPSDRFLDDERQLLFSVFVFIPEQPECKKGEVDAINGDPFRQHKIALLDLLHDSLVLLLLLIDESINAWFAIKRPVSINLLSREEAIEHGTDMISILPQLNPSLPVFFLFFLVRLDSSQLLLGQATVIDFLKPTSVNLSKYFIDFGLLGSI